MYISFIHTWSPCCFLIFSFSFLSFFLFLPLTVPFFLSSFSLIFIHSIGRKLPCKYWTLLCKQGSLYHGVKKQKDFTSYNLSWWEMEHFLPCRSIQEGCHSYQRLQPSSVDWWVWKVPRKNISVVQQPSDCSHSYSEPWGSSGYEKTRITAPDSWDAYERNPSSKHRLLHLPAH